jgi:hypothetical protein
MCHRVTGKRHLASKVVRAHDEGAANLRMAGKDYLH